MCRDWSEKERFFFFVDCFFFVSGDFNFSKRLQSCDLTGRIALVTGGRVKIGFMIVLKLLRANCRVIVVTRFARDAVVRFSKESDFQQWSKNLQVEKKKGRRRKSLIFFSLKDSWS